MKKCTKCGSKLPDGINFCSQCGEALENGNPIPQKNPNEPPKASRAPKVPRRKSSYLPVMAGVAAALLIVVIILGFFVINHKDSVTGTWRFEKMEVTKFPVTDWESAGIELRLLPNKRFIIKASDLSINGTYETEKADLNTQIIILTYDNKTDKILYKEDHIYIPHEGYHLILSR